MKRTGAAVGVALLAASVAGCTYPTAPAPAEPFAADSAAPSVADDTASPVPSAVSDPVGATQRVPLISGTAAVTLLSVRHHASSVSAVDGSKLRPDNGSFVVLDVRIKCLSGSCEYNPLFWSYQDREDRSYAYLDGRSSESNFPPLLGSGTLRAGQATRGRVPIDAPAAGQDVQLQSGIWDSITEWTL